MEQPLAVFSAGDGRLHQQSGVRRITSLPPASGTPVYTWGAAEQVFAGG